MDIYLIYSMGRTIGRHVSSMLLAIPFLLNRRPALQVVVGHMLVGLAS